MDIQLDETRNFISSASGIGNGIVKRWFTMFYRCNQQSVFVSKNISITLIFWKPTNII
jgi:hypothetical protein